MSMSEIHYEETIVVAGGYMWSTNIYIRVRERHCSVMVYELSYMKRKSEMAKAIK